MLSDINQWNNEKGIVLLRTVIATVLNTVVLLFLVTMCISFTSMYTDQKANLSIVQEGQVVREWFSRDVLYADNITVLPTKIAITNNEEYVLYQIKENCLYRNGKQLTNGYTRITFIEEMINKKPLATIKLQNDNITLCITAGKHNY